MGNDKDKINKSKIDHTELDRGMIYEVLLGWPRIEGQPTKIIGEGFEIATY